MVGRFVENQKIGLRDDAREHIATRRFSPPESESMERSPVGAIQVRHGGLDAAIDGPAIERDDAFLEFGVAPRFGGQRFELGNAIEDVLRAGANVLPNRLVGIEGEILGQITDDQVAPLA